MKCDYNRKFLNSQHTIGINVTTLWLAFPTSTKLGFVTFVSGIQAWTLVQGSQNSTITSLPYKSGGHKKQASEDGSNFSSWS
jgi:hypothetical protein